MNGESTAPKYRYLIILFNRSSRSSTSPSYTLEVFSMYHEYFTAEYRVLNIIYMECQYQELSSSVVYKTRICEELRVRLF
jgi:hypothetical protein